MSNILLKLKRIKIKDIFDIWKLPIAMVFAPFYKIISRNLWIVCEDENEARDNGYWFFKYLRTIHPEQNCVYAIKKQSVDFEKVKALGKTVEYNSLLHWIMYFASTKKISSQKAGNPNAAIFYFLEVYGILKNKRIFLQHGVIINNTKWLYYKATKMLRFICGTYPEYEYINDKFGYPKNYVKYTGLCRFDGLHDYKKDKNLILIMPTWREWIADEDGRLLQYEGTTEIAKTNYFVKWIDFIADMSLAEIANNFGVKIIFFPHRNMQKYIKFFPKTGEFIQIAGASEYDVQDLLKRASLLITDYSSVSFDFIYMKKPLIFYQFDYANFRKGQYGEGYFDYKDNPFANSFSEKEDVLKEIEKHIKNHFAVSDQYLKAHSDYFRLCDTNNCERVYKITKEL